MAHEKIPSYDTTLGGWNPSWGLGRLAKSMTKWDTTFGKYELATVSTLPIRISQYNPADIPITQV